MDTPAPTNLDDGVQVVEGGVASAQVTPAVLSSAREFAEALRVVDKGNETLVTTKDPSAPRLSAAAIEALPLSRPGAVGIAPAGPGESRRSSLVRAPAPTTQVRDELIAAIEAAGGEVYRSFDISPVLGVRFEDASAEAVLRILLTHPAVDFFEANQIRRVYLDEAGLDPSAPAEPVGSNELDIKHFFHSVADTLAGVEDAWDYTRGDGVTIGVMDTGMTGTSSGDWHVDADSTTSGGIIKRGFVDDYNGVTGCPPNSQPDGECIARDDTGHGTRMAGLIGANDNNIRSVGIAPEARVVSMKVIMDCHTVIAIHGSWSDCGNLQPLSDDGFRLEMDDFEAALSWAMADGVDILSMSFSIPGIDATTVTALETAHDTYGIAMFSSTGTKSALDEPQSRSVVMGVGGLSFAGESVGLEAHQEVSALSAGTTLGHASCSNLFSGFCTQGSAPRVYADTAGNTSASTAITSGIAALVLSENPSMTPDDLYERLIDTSEGPHNRINAWRAVSGTFFLSTGLILGSDCLEDGESETWSINVSEGKTPYSYEWEVEVESEDPDEYPELEWVGDGSTYTATMGEEEWFGEPEPEPAPFLLRVTVTDDVDDEQVRELEVGFEGGIEGC